MATKKTGTKKKIVKKSPKKKAVRKLPAAEIMDDSPENVALGKDEAVKGTKKKKAPTKKKVPVFDMADFATGISKLVDDKKKPRIEVMAFSSENVVGHVTGFYSTGSIAINKGLGLPGLPFGRVVEVAGENSVGKTTLAMECLADVQKQGGMGFLLDIEEKFDKKYAIAIGVDVDKLVVIQPKVKTFEAVIDSINFTLDYWENKGLKDVPSLIVWDSLAATPSESEIRKDAGDNAQVGGASKLLRGAFRVLTGRLAKTNMGMLCINQFYTDIKTGFAAKFGSKKETYGGGAVKYHSTIRITLIHREKILLTDGTHIGQKVICRVIKNNLANPFREPEFAVTFGVGFDNTIVLFWALSDLKLIRNAGAWYYLTLADGTEVTFQKKFIGLGILFGERPDIRKYCVEKYKEI